MAYRVIKCSIADDGTLNQADNRFVRKLDSYADVSHMSSVDSRPDPDANGLLVASEKDYNYVDSFFVW